MKIDIKNTLTMVIDYQEKLVPVMNNTRDFIHNSTIFLQGLDILKVPHIITQQYTKGLGDTIPEILQACGEEHRYGGVCDKITFSAVRNKEIADCVEQAGRKNILICGCEAHICVLQTVIDLKSSGYNVILVTDCIASRKVSDWEMAVQRAKQEGAALTTYEAILFELLEAAGTAEFKKISALIK